jgi:chemotaxis protein MotB
MGRGGLTPSEMHGTAEAQVEMEAIEAALLGKGGDSLLEAELQRHVTVRLTDEGVVIELFDLPERPLFDGAVPTDLLDALVGSIAPELAMRPNMVAVEAHLATPPIVMLDPALWERSAARAESLRRLLAGQAVEDGRIARLTGHADRRPADANPLSPRNNRVEIVLLRNVPRPEGRAWTHRSGAVDEN